MAKRLSSQKRRVCYVNPDPKTLDADLAFFEKRLKLLGQLELATVPSIESPNFLPCDLLVLNASHIPTEAFPKWLLGLSHKILRQKNIPVPALIFAPLDFSRLNEMAEAAYQMNWYFDIIHPQHMESLPIRVANLLRIHDHLHELQRYEDEVKTLQKKVEDIEHRLQGLKP
ncbi:MAG: hypothetical protein HYW48_11170 [Deltaproteobacteria bacterium]|nr:hypothetical protein [Deltaproteobacteria bacterium]